MTPQRAKGQGVRRFMHSFAWRPLEDSRWRQAMMAYFGCFVPMCWVGNQASSVCCAISLAEVAIVAWRWRREESVAGAVSPWRNSAKSSCARTHGTPSHVPRGKPALMKLTSMPTLSRKKTRKKDREAVASARGAPERGAALRSSEDYAVRGGPVDPRGRKSDAGPRAANPRWPARAEGEKRFRSATRNP
jgi:hypothetical protein